MLGEWLTPVLAWLGIGLIPFLLLVLIVIVMLKN